MNNKQNYLLVENGDIYPGGGYGAKVNSVGELVFNTSMTGYQEVITDPSYKGQIVVFTYPHIGNIGTCNEDNESNQIWLGALITRETPTNASSWRSTKNLNYYLLEHNIPGLAGIDTRKLTKLIRNNGNLYGMVVRDTMHGKEELLKILKRESLCRQQKSLYNISNQQYKIDQYHNEGDIHTLHVAIIDLGCKGSIVNMLKLRRCKISVLSFDCSIDFIKSQNIDAILLSNGPGNPELYTCTINLVKHIIKEQFPIPILGICLGHQILGIALGAKIEKLQFGHHGINHPVKDLSNGKVCITSQNHNYVISKTSLPSEISVTHISLFDNSIQGFICKERFMVGFQGHPEGSPGPIDIQKDIVEKFLTQVFMTKSNLSYNLGRRS